MPGFATSEVVLSAAVADGGTFTVPYPTGTNSGDFSQAFGHYMMINGTKYRQPADIGLSFGTSSVTVTNRSGATLAANSRVFFNFERPGTDKTVALGFGNLMENVNAKRINGIDVVRINLGAPITADADGICASQSGTAATAMSLNGALASGGTVTLDVPRNVVGAWTNTAVLTVVGTDEYGNAMIEQSASGTSMTGVKAFKTITSVTPSANITSATVGTGDVLGLPIHLPNGAADVIKEIQDNAAATAGTTVAGLAKNTESTATTADVRGTYDPNAACDGSKAFSLLVALYEPAYPGNPQYTV